MKSVKYETVHVPEELLAARLNGNSIGIGLGAFGIFFGVLAVISFTLTALSILVFSWFNSEPPEVVVMLLFLASMVAAYLIVTPYLPRLWKKVNEEASKNMYALYKAVQEHAESQGNTVYGGGWTVGNLSAMGFPITDADGNPGEVNQVQITGPNTLSYCVVIAHPVMSDPL